MSGFDNDVVFAKNADFSQSDNQNVSESNGLATNGQLWIGSTATNAGGTHISVGSLTSPGGTITIGYSSPNITLEASASVPTTFTANSGSATPSSNNLNIFGAITTAGTSPLVTTGAGSTITAVAQLSQALAAGDSSKVGLCNFDSSSFSVSASGFVTLAGGSIAVDSFAVQTGTSPVVPTSAGLVTLNGAVVAAGTNPIRTDGTGANTIAIEVQTSQAIAAADATKIGLANFDSAAFDVSATGFVQLNGGGIAATAFDVQANTAPGTDPVVPTAAGVVTINGAAVANHSVVLETRSRAANAYNLEVQYSASAAATDATKSGVSHFNSAQFSVDANGFVSLASSGFTWTDVTSATQTLAVQNGYLTDRGAGVTYTLPATAAIGDEIRIVGKLGLATITPNANQQILMGAASGAVGAGGTAVATNAGDCIDLICTTAGASTVWRAANWVGSWTLN